MKKILKILLCVSFILMIGCNDGGGDGGEEKIIPPYTEMLIEVLYKSVSIEPFDTHFYKFIPESDGSYTISLTNLASDMGWVLYTNPDIMNPGVIDQQDDFLANNDEIGTTPFLTGGVTYYLAIDEWDNVIGSYDLQIQSILGINRCPLKEGNILAAFDNTLYEYTLTGQLIRSIEIPSTGGDTIKDITIDQNGDIHITYDTTLSTYDLCSNIWKHNINSGWDSGGSPSFGAIGTYQNFVYAADCGTGGIIRFDIDDYLPEKFAQDYCFIDLNIGLDGFLYGLSNDNDIRNTVMVYDPITMAHLKTINFDRNLDAIAINQYGEFFAASLVGDIYHFANDGRLLKSIKTDLIRLMDIDISLNGQLVISNEGDNYPNSLLLSNVSLDNTRNIALDWMKPVFVSFIPGFGSNTGCEYVEYINNEFPSEGKPAVPIIASAVPGNEQVSINWYGSVKAISYNLYFSTAQNITTSTGELIADVTSPFSHTDLTNGMTYYYIVTAVNNKGESDISNEVSATPYNIKPVANILGPKGALIGEEVVFDASTSYDSDGSIVSYSFDYGDGTPTRIVDSPVINHTYNTIGDYTLTVTVTDNQEATGSTVKQFLSGIAMSEPLNLSNTPDQALGGADVCIGDNGIINVAWEEAEVKFTKSVNGGTNFVAPIIAIHRQPEGSHKGVDIACNSNEVHLISDVGLQDIVYSRLDEASDLFSDPLTISNIDSTIKKLPSMSTDGIDKIGVVWEERECDGSYCGQKYISYTRSIDTGVTFSSPISLAFQDIDDPNISLFGQNVYIFWEQDDWAQFSRSIDGGISFSPPISLPQFYDGKANKIKSIVDSAGNIHAVWRKTSDNKHNIMYAISKDDGLTFSYKLLFIVDDEHRADYLSISASENGSIYISWRIFVPFGETSVFMVFSSDGGTTFTEPLNLYYNSQDIYNYTRIVAFGDNKFGLLYMAEKDLYYVNCEVSVP
jgi:hypothetical protein